MNEKTPTPEPTNPEQNPTPKKQRRISVLQVLIILTVLNILAWAAIQVVDHGPGVISWLGDKVTAVRDSQLSILPVQSADPTSINLAHNETSLTTDTETTVTWSTTNDDEVFYFTYSCSGGIAVSVSTATEDVAVACEEPYNIGATTSLTLTVTTNETQFTDLIYTITGARGDVITSLGAHTLTVENPDIGDVFADNSNETLDSTDTTSPTPTVAGVNSTATTPVTTRPTPQPYVYEYIPTSNPAGTTDLAARFFTAGTIINNTYIAGLVTRNHTGAIQFEVRNLGSKTSDEWTYQVTLPDGRNYTSPTQAPLKPNERALLTIGFPTPDITGHTFVVTTHTSVDTAPLNSNFSQYVAFNR